MKLKAKMFTGVSGVLGRMLGRVFLVPETGPAKPKGGKRRSTPF
jgi:hypothetical protein